MKRRTFIIVIAAAGLAIGSWWVVNLIKGLFSDPVIRPESLSLIMGDNDLRAVGEHYRSEFPEESEEGILLQKLLGKERELPAGRDDFDARIREDFKAGRVVVLDGWVLSVTEARQCALFSIKA